MDITTLSHTHIHWTKPTKNSVKIVMCVCVCVIELTLYFLQVCVPLNEQLGTLFSKLVIGF